jgi:non-specific protein-tyrosine kinase
VFTPLKEPHMAQPNLVTLTDPRSAASEAYRSLRTNLMFSSVETPIRTLLITTPTPDADAPAAVANLAVTLAQAGNRTILVDADLRQPAQHTLWGVTSSGLTRMMLDDSLLASPPLVDTVVEHLQVLPAGDQAPNPADLLSSKRMNDIIGVLKARAAYVLFSSPPVLSATDAALLSTKLDGVVLVVRHGKTRREDVQRARDALQRLNARVIGAVLTHAPKDRANY